MVYICVDWDLHGSDSVFYRHFDRRTVQLEVRLPEDAYPFFLQESEFVFIHRQTKNLEIVFFLHQ